MALEIPKIQELECRAVPAPHTTRGGTRGVVKFDVGTGRWHADRLLDGVAEVFAHGLGLFWGNLANAFHFHIAHGLGRTGKGHGHGAF